MFSMGQKAIDLMSEDELAVYAGQLETTFSTLDIEILEFMLLPVPFDLHPYRNAQLMASNRLRKREGELREFISREKNQNIRHGFFKNISITSHILSHPNYKVDELQINIVMLFAGSRTDGMR